MDESIAAVLVIAVQGVALFFVIYFAVGLAIRHEREREKRA